jgi:hypothetical protein
VYPPPVYSVSGFTGTGPGLTIDIGTATLAGYPPVIICTYNNAGSISYLIEGSHDAVNFNDFSGGGFTASESKDLIPGIRFWRVNVVSNTGVLTASVGAVPTQDGGTFAMNNVIVSTNATQGQ